MINDLTALEGHIADLNKHAGKVSPTSLKKGHEILVKLAHNVQVPKVVTAADSPLDTVKKNVDDLSKIVGNYDSFEQTVQQYGGPFFRKLDALEAAVRAMRKRADKIKSEG